MPTATVRGATIAYDVLGKSGPWFALSPGGRRGKDEVKGLAQRIADGGFRVLVYDRRNCGASDVVLEGDEFGIRDLGRRSLRAVEAAERAAGLYRRRVVGLPALDPLRAAPSGCGEGACC